MRGWFLDEWIACLGVIGIDEFLGRERRTALLALVAISTQAVAVRTLAADITVGEEVTGLGVIELLGGLLDELAVVVELAEVIRSQLVMNGGSGARVDIKRDTKIRERAFDV